MRQTEHARGLAVWQTSPLAWGLRSASWLYAAAIHARNAYYDRVSAASRRMAAPVISVGNLTTGGTGKTPLVIEIARLVQQLGQRPAILTRGYATRPGQTPDEVQEFHEAAPDVPVIVDADRVRGAAMALREGRERDALRDAASSCGRAVDCLVLDDGFQHRRLRRDLDIVVIDTLDPWGGRKLLPAGRLREPLTSLRRGHVFILSRANQADAFALKEISRTILRLQPGARLIEAHIAAARLMNADGIGENPEQLRPRRVLPVCGLGNPRTFLRLIESLTARLCPPLLFADHHAYTPADIGQIIAAARRESADSVVTTRKDWWKLVAAAGRAGDGAWLLARLVRLDVGVTFADGGAALRRMIEQTLQTWSKS